MSFGNRPPSVRADGRRPGDLRPVTMTLGVQKWAEGSCIIRVGDTQVLLSDGRCTGKASFSGISLALSADSPAEADRLFNAPPNEPMGVRHALRMSASKSLSML